MKDSLDFKSDNWFSTTEYSVGETNSNTENITILDNTFSFRNNPNWTITGELMVNGVGVRFQVLQPTETKRNYIAIGKNTSGKLAFWWSTAYSTEASKVYTENDILNNEWYPFSITKKGANVTFCFNNDSSLTFSIDLDYFDTIEYLTPSVFKWLVNGGSVRNVRVITGHLSFGNEAGTVAEGNHLHSSWISYGQVDSTSTSTVFTATVPNLTELIDGATIILRNGIVTSASGFTLNVNGLGAKPVYSNLADATRDTTIFNISYTMLFVYDSTRISGGCWICYRGYDSNTNTIGYQIRTNSTKFTATDKGYRYRIWLETSDGKYMPVNTSTSTNATANRSSAMNTREFWLGGKILYNSTDGTTEANATMSATTLWQQYSLSLGYSFNNTGSALVLTSNNPLYMVAEDRGNGKARLTSPYYTQTLPSSEDNKLYIYLGHMYSATNLELALDHPIYEYKNGSIRKYRNNYTTGEIDSIIGNIVDILMGTGGT